MFATVINTINNPTNVSEDNWCECCNAWTDGVLPDDTYIHKLCRDADKRCIWEDSTVQVRTERSKVRATQ